MLSVMIEVVHVVHRNEMERLQFGEPHDQNRIGLSLVVGSRMQLKQ